MESKFLNFSRSSTLGLLACLSYVTAASGTLNVFAEPPLPPISDPIEGHPVTPVRYAKASVTLYSVSYGPSSGVQSTEVCKKEVEVPVFDARIGHHQDGDYYDTAQVDCEMTLEKGDPVHLSASAHMAYYDFRISKTAPLQATKGFNFSLFAFRSGSATSPVEGVENFKTASAASHDLSLANLILSGPAIEVYRSNNPGDKPTDSYAQTVYGVIEFMDPPVGRP